MNKLYYAIIGLLLLGIGLVVALPNRVHPTSSNIGIKNTEDNIGSGDNTAIGSNLTGENKNSLVYINREYGFQLTLPKGWEDYRVFIYTGSNIESGVSISFALPTSEKARYGVMDPNDPNRFILGYTGQYKYIKGYADMFILNIWTYKGYQKIINTEDAIWTKDTREGAIRGKSEKYFYTMNSWPQDLPIDISKKIKFGSYYEDIKNSFKIL